MNIQTSKRIMCCLLAVLFLGFCFTRPLAITAHATGAETAAMAGFVGIAPEVGIPLILALLGISAIAANWEDICATVDNLYDSIVTAINDVIVIPAYEYNDRIYVEKDIIETVASAVDTYFGLTYEDAWELGSANFSKMFTYKLSNSSHKLVVWSERTPAYTHQDDGSLAFTIYQPCVIYTYSYGAVSIEDHTKESDYTTISYINTTLVDSTVTPVVPEINTDDTITVVPEEEEEIVVPIAIPDDIPIVESEEEVPVVPVVAETDLTGVLSWLKTIWQAITGLASKIVEPIAVAITAVKTAVNTGITTITDTITETINAIIEWLTSIGASLSDILEWIKTLPASIAQAISTVITDVFVPSADFISEKVDAITSRFAWIAPLVDIAQGLSVDLSSSTPPVVYVHLEDSESEYIKGGTVKFIDMSWYARYKPYGDVILSGFLWALFAWRMYLKIPGIINGVGGSVGHIASSGGYRRKEDGE